MRTAKTSHFETAVQDLYVENWHNDQRVNHYWLHAGEQVEIISGDGYTTVVRSSRLKWDMVTCENAGRHYTEEQHQEARDRLERAAEGEDEEKVYGPLFAASSEG
jgi:hypothetical protein